MSRQKKGGHGRSCPAGHGNKEQDTHSLPRYQKRSYVNSRPLRRVLLGHSLGGGLASYGAAGFVGTAYTFNSAGIDLVLLWWSATDKLRSQDKFGRHSVQLGVEMILSRILRLPGDALFFGALYTVAIGMSWIFLVVILQGDLGFFLGEEQLAIGVFSFLTFLFYAPIAFIFWLLAHIKRKNVLLAILYWVPNIAGGGRDTHFLAHFHTSFEPRLVTGSVGG